MNRESIENRLQRAQERLQGALITGDSTEPHRAAIALLQADLAKVLDQDRRDQATKAETSAGDVAKRSAALAGIVVADLVQTVAPHEIPPSAEETAILELPAVAAATRALAFSQSAFVRAEVTYQSAVADVEALQSRLAVLDNAIKEISDQRRAGELTDRQAAIMMGFRAEDAADLSQLIATAEQQMHAVAPNPAQVIQAQADLDREIAFAKFIELGRRVEAIEAALLNAVASRFQIGVTLGNPQMLSSAWIPSRALFDALHFGSIPEVSDAG